MSKFVKHKLYDNFKPEEKVCVKSYSELEHLLHSKYVRKEWQYDYYLKYAGLETAIDKMFDLCCVLNIDSSKYTWSYDWIHKKEEHLANDLFEI